MESPKTGLILLALVAITTASGAFLGWTMRPLAAPAEAARSANGSPAEASSTASETPVPAEPGSEKQPASSQ